MSDGLGEKRLRNVDRALLGLAITRNVSTDERLVMLVVACAPEATTPMISEITGLTPRRVESVAHRLVTLGLLLRL